MPVSPLILKESYMVKSNVVGIAQMMATLCGSGADSQFTFGCENGSIGFEYVC